MDVQCCVCKRFAIETPRGREWKAREPSPGEKVSSTYCPECLEDARKEIRKIRRKVLDSSEPSVKLLEPLDNDPSGGPE